MRGLEASVCSPPGQLRPQPCSPASFPDGLPRGPDEAVEKIEVFAEPI